jgi:hypothetical protein
MGDKVRLDVWRQRLLPLVEQHLARRLTPAVQVIESPERITVRVSLAELTMRVPVDSYGVPLWQPPVREVFRRIAPAARWSRPAGRCRQRAARRWSGGGWR